MRRAERLPPDRLPPPRPCRVAACTAARHIRGMLRSLTLVALVLGLTLVRPTPAPVAATVERPAPPTATTTATTQDRPALVVLIAVDQMRADYLDRFAPQLTGGLARLMREGARFTDAHHDHAITETAPGHATLLAGRYPRSTGIMLNREGVDDDAAPLVANGYGPGASPRRFQGTTLYDWMKAADGRTKVLSVSMKDRAAILPVGRAKADVYWYSLDGRFLTSTWYRRDVPAWLRRFNERRLPASYAGKTWALLLADSAYREPDSVSAEMGGRRFTFPHQLPDDELNAQSELRITPFIDDVVLDLALEGVTAMELGKGPQADLLAISLSATDVIGHNYGPDSREMHDQILRLDRALGRFLDSLATLRDRARVTVVLTADHGVAPIPELAPATVTPKPVRANLYPLMPALRAQLRTMGVDTFALELDQQILLSDRRKFKRPADLDSAVEAFARAARQQPGVLRADRWSQILADSARDPIARRWAHQFPAVNNVELVVTLHPFSTWGGNVASHGSPHGYDSQVPLIFAGAGVTRGTHTGFVRTVDIAPTLAALLGIKPDGTVDGVVLPLR